MRSPGPSIWLLLVLFVGLGVAMTAWEPTRSVAVGPVWLAGSLLVALLYAVLVARAARIERLRRSGVAGTARALAVRELKLSVHEMPHLELDLEVQGPSGAHKLTQRVLAPLSALEPLRAGEWLPVRLDPDDPDRIAFDWGVATGPRASWIARALGGPERIDSAALEREAAHLAGPEDAAP